MTNAAGNDLGGVGVASGHFMYGWTNAMLDGTAAFEMAELTQQVHSTEATERYFLYLQNNGELYGWGQSPDGNLQIISDDFIPVTLLHQNVRLPWLGVASGPPQPWTPPAEHPPETEWTPPTHPQQPVQQVWDLPPLRGYVVPADINNIGGAINRSRMSTIPGHLAADEILSNIAAFRATELFLRISHLRPDGSDWSTVLAESDLNPYYRMEHIAFGFTTEEAVIDYWMNHTSFSTVHRESHWTRFGIGRYIDEYGINYWVLITTSNY
jgi:hypothetical protein